MAYSTSAPKLLFKLLLDTIPEETLADILAEDEETIPTSVTTWDLSAYALDSETELAPDSRPSSPDSFF